MKSFVRQILCPTNFCLKFYINDKQASSWHNSSLNVYSFLCIMKANYHHRTETFAGLCWCHPYTVHCKEDISKQFGNKTAEQNFLTVLSRYLLYSISNQVCQRIPQNQIYLNKKLIGLYRITQSELASFSAWSFAHSSFNSAKFFLTSLSMSSISLLS